MDGDYITRAEHEQALADLQALFKVELEHQMQKLLKDLSNSIQRGILGGNKY